MRSQFLLNPFLHASSRAGSRQAHAAGCGLALCMTGLSLLPEDAAAGDATWNIVSNAFTASWNANANWNPNTTFPNGIGDIATMNSANITGGVVANVVNLNVAITVGQLLLGDTNNTAFYSIRGGTAGSLIFDNTGTTNAVLTVSSTAAADNIQANITLNDSIDISANSTTNSFTITGNISEGPAGKALNKAGSGLLALSGTNTYTGTTTIENGILRATGASALGSGTSAIALGNAASISSNLNPTLRVNGATILARDVTVGASNSATSGIHSIDTDNGATAAGISGVITLNQNLSVSGTTTAGFTLSGNITSGSAGARTATFTGNSGGVLAASGVIGGGTGTIALVKSGAATLTLSGTNTYTDGTTIGGGILDINSDAALGTAPVSPATSLTFSGSGSLRLAGATSALTLNANRNIVINTGATATFNANGATKVLTINGVVSNQSNTGSFALATSGSTAASGTVVLAGSNDFAAGSTISLGGASGLGGGILRLTNSNALGSNAVTVNGAAAGGPSWGEAALELSGGITIGSNVSFNIAGHSGGGTPAGDNLRNFSGNNTYNGAINITTTGGSYQINSSEAGSLLTIGGDISNKLNTVRTLNFIGAGNTLASGVLAEAGTTGTQLSIVKSGAGTLTLSGTSTYTGTTTVSAGTLLVNGSLGGTAVTVSLGTFGGTGTVAGSVNVGAATYAPGSSPGSLEIAGNLTLGGASTTGIELGGTAFTLNGTEEHDRTKLTGSTPVLTLAGALAVSLFGGFSLGDGQAFGIFQLGSGATRSGTFAGFGEDASVGTFGGRELFITYEGNFGDTGPVATFGGNDIVLYTVPEPGAGALGALGMIALLRRRRR